MILTPEQRVFATANHSLIYSFLNRYKLNFEDWYDVAALGFCKAVGHYDQSKKIAFSSFAYVVMLNAIRMEMRKERNAFKTVSLQDTLGDGFLIGDTIGYEQDFTPVSEMLPKFTATLRQDEKKIFAFFLAGNTQNEIAKAVGRSQPQVSRKLKAITRGFRTFYEENSL